MLWALAAGAQGGNAPLFVTDIQVMDNGELLMTCKGDKTLRLYDGAGLKVLKSWKLDQTPTGVAVKGKQAYVTCFDTEGKVAVIDLSVDGIVKTIPAASGATGPLLNNDGSKLYVCNQFAGTVSEINLQSGTLERNVKVLREPKKLCLARTEKRCL